MYLFLIINNNFLRNEDPEVDDQGNKWSLSAFLRHLKSQGIDTGMLMRSIEDVIIKSLLAASYQMNTATNMFVPHSRNCFGKIFSLFYNILTLSLLNTFFWRKNESLQLENLSN